MNRLALFALGVVLHPSLSIRDVDGVRRQPLKVEPGHLSAVIFVASDCPISNYYSHEIRRICDTYAPRGLDCALVYTDPAIKNEAAAKHAHDYGHGSYPKLVDRDRALVEATGATITPEVVLIRPDESIAYRGRIDNYYADLTKPRTKVTEHDWIDALDAILAGKPVAKPEVPAVGCYIPDKKFYR